MCWSQLTYYNSRSGFDVNVLDIIILFPHRNPWDTALFLLTPAVSAPAQPECQFVLSLLAHANKSGHNVLHGSRSNTPTCLLGRMLGESASFCKTIRMIYVDTLSKKTLLASSQFISRLVVITINKNSCCYLYSWKLRHLPTSIVVNAHEVTGIPNLVWPVAHPEL